MSKTASPGEFCWNELMTNDVQKCKEFYKALFGWETQEHNTEHFTYTLLKKGEKEIGGMMQIPADHAKEIPPHWMSYIYVENIEESLAKAKSLGATIKRELTSCGEYGRFAIMQDPTGAHIAIWESAK